MRRLKTILWNASIIKYMVYLWNILSYSNLRFQKLGFCQGLNAFFMEHMFYKIVLYLQINKELFYVIQVK